MCGSSPAMPRSPPRPCCAERRRSETRSYGTDAGRKKMEITMTHPRPLPLAFAAVAALTMTASANAADLLKITVGQRGNWDTSIAYLGEKAGIFKKHGIELEIIYTSGSGETLQPVIAGSVDLGFPVGTHGAMAGYAKR